MGCTRAIGVGGGGTAPFTWKASGLPPGMSFRTGSGATLAYVSPGDLELWGTSTAVGTYHVTVDVTDANGRRVQGTVEVFRKPNGPYFDPKSPLYQHPRYADANFEFLNTREACTIEIGTRQ